MKKIKNKKARGTALRPRLSVFRSNKQIYAQIIDDASSHTLLACSTLDEEVKSQIKSGASISASTIVGEILGKRLLEKNITQIIFDRNGKPYHGRVKAIADGIRNIGLNF